MPGVASQREKSELFSLTAGSEEGGGARPRPSRGAALKQSSRLTDDLLTATRMIQQNTDKSTRTLDKLGNDLSRNAIFHGTIPPWRRLGKCLGIFLLCSKTLKLV